jgi:hypothetical protein
LLQPVGTNILVSPEEKLIAQSIYGNTWHLHFAEEEGPLV